MSEEISDRFAPTTKERFYICTQCGELTDSTKIDEALMNGGNDFCYCGYMEQQWSVQENCFQPVYFRICVSYKEIPQEIYDMLLVEENTVLRLKMYQSWRAATGKK